ncbi:ATP-dependent helicase [Alcaligenes sp. SMD-FA]|uniref:ATP-dependent helicase n=1 Tax=Alcaligenes sp. SMD-FA TaxID=2991054 RepID=UPI002226C53A|nr:ATP-dependent helicase [Alcaligenes sp. SMD-FA]UYY89213.1 ATP-dependent helicase [Alcaligenes sp. SMD-FA]
MIKGFIGGAGCGKTHQLMEALGDHLEMFPLQEGQKVLALTFMHGSRRRLEDRLKRLPTLIRRTDCSTIDSFAWRLVQRWSSLVEELGFTDIQPDDYERVCDAAGQLLQIDDVCGWVASTFPIFLVDEAQDMTQSRLRIVQGLVNRLTLFVAADEFQCLNENLRPNPACEWLGAFESVIELTQPRRTSNLELLNAATAIREGRPPVSDNTFRIELTPRPPLAGAWVNGNLRFYGGGRSVAVITPALGDFAQASILWAANNTTRGGAGPYTISWEESEARSVANFLERIVLQSVNDIPYITSLLSDAGDRRLLHDLVDWMDIQRRAKGRTDFSKEEIEQAIKKSFSQRRRLGNGGGRKWHGMTVHGAKNREFDNVIVLWPAAVSGTDEQKRRLLYNAVTRAKERCLVLVQAGAHLRRAPFT